MTKASTELQINGSPLDYERTFDPVRDVEELRQRLSRAPFKIGKDYQKHDHVPVSVLEWTMDYVFGPCCWSVSETMIDKLGGIGQTSDKNPRAGIVCIVKVRAIHPLLDTFTEQTGIASGDYTPGKFKTAFSALQKLAFKNACKKWGKVFGRDLNRGIKEELSDHYSRAQILSEWEEQGIKSMPELSKALKLAQKKYGKSLDLNGLADQYKNKHFKEK